MVFGVPILKHFREQFRHSFSTTLIKINGDVDDQTAEMCRPTLITPPCFFSAIYYNGELASVAFCCFPGGCHPSKSESTLKGKNLLMEEQILSFKSGPPIRRHAKKKW